MITHSCLDNSGLDKIGVWEAGGEMGAKMAFVGSFQQFYYSIGFRPYLTSTWWRFGKNKLDATKEAVCSTM